MSVEHIIDRGVPVASWAKIRGNSIVSDSDITGDLLTVQEVISDQISFTGLKPALVSPNDIAYYRQDIDFVLDDANVKSVLTEDGILVKSEIGTFDNEDLVISRNFTQRLLARTNDTYIKNRTLTENLALASENSAIANEIDVISLYKYYSNTGPIETETAKSFLSADVSIGEIKITFIGRMYIMTFDIIKPGAAVTKTGDGKALLKIPADNWLIPAGQIGTGKYLTILFNGCSGSTFIIGEITAQLSTYDDGGNPGLQIEIGKNFGDLANTNPVFPDQTIPVTIMGNITHQTLY